MIQTISNKARSYGLRIEKYGYAIKIENILTSQAVKILKEASTPTAIIYKDIKEYTTVTYNISDNSCEIASINAGYVNYLSVTLEEIFKNHLVEIHGEEKLKLLISSQDTQKTTADDLSIFKKNADSFLSKILLKIEKFPEIKEHLKNNKYSYISFSQKLQNNLQIDISYFYTGNDEKTLYGFEEKNSFHLRVGVCKIEEYADSYVVLNKSNANQAKVSFNLSLELDDCADLLFKDFNTVFKFQVLDSEIDKQYRILLKRSREAENNG